MFYAQFVLAKKGALSKIWLAAHWERKLSKAQIFETDVQGAVDEILRPKQKMTLRTTGHLLLGVVRIYSKKAKYILADCNEAFIKIKMAFRPGSAELSMLRDSRGERSTSEDILEDLDSIIPDMSDFDYTPGPMQQCRIDDITLQEDNFETRSLRDDDLFNDEDFDDCASNFDAEFERTRLNFEKLKQDEELELSRRSMSYMSDGDKPLDSRAQSVRTDDTDEATTDQPDSADYGLEEPMEVETNGHDHLVLEPLTDSQLNSDKERLRQKRRRKLVTDDSTVISGEEMKNNLADFSDTLTVLELAPPTKRLMKIKEVGQLDRIFNSPATDIYLNDGFNKFYQSHLIPQSRTGEEYTADDVRRSLGMLDTIEDDFENDDPNPESFDYENGDYDALPEDDENGDENGVDTPVKEERKSSRRRSDKHEEEEDEQEDDGETEEHVLGKRTLGVLHAISTKFKQGNEKQIVLEDLLKKNASRKAAAQKFYAVLELQKSQAVRVKQDFPYGPIKVAPGPNLHEFEPAR